MMNLPVVSRGMINTTDRTRRPRTAGAAPAAVGRSRFDVRPRTAGYERHSGSALRRSDYTSSRPADYRPRTAGSVGRGTSRAKLHTSLDALAPVLGNLEELGQKRTSDYLGPRSGDVAAFGIAYVTRIENRNYSRFVHAGALGRAPDAAYASSHLLGSSHAATDANQARRTGSVARRFSTHSRKSTGSAHELYGTVWQQSVSNSNEKEQMMGLQVAALNWKIRRRSRRDMMQAGFSGWISSVRWMWRYIGIAGWPFHVWKRYWKKQKTAQQAVNLLKAEFFFLKLKTILRVWLHHYRRQKTRWLKVQAWQARNQDAMLRELLALWRGWKDNCIATRHAIMLRLFQTQQAFQVMSR